MPSYQASILFMHNLRHNPLWVSSWLNILMLVNLASAFFWPHIVAQLIFYSLLIRAALLLMSYVNIVSKRALGLGQVLWCALVVYLVFMLMNDDPSLHGSFKLYVSGLIMCNSLSLIFEWSLSKTVLVTASKKLVKPIS